MAEIGIVNITDIAGEGIFADILSKVSFVSTLLQALGGVVVIYIIFSIINIIIRKKEVRLFKEIRDSLKVIEKKLGK